MQSCLFCRITCGRIPTVGSRTNWCWPAGTSSHGVRCMCWVILALITSWPKRPRPTQLLGRMLVVRTGLRSIKGSTDGFQSIINYRSRRRAGSRTNYAHARRSR